MATSELDTKEAQWYVMRDFTRYVTHFSFRQFEEAGFRVYTPMVWRMAGRMKYRKRVYMPLIRDMFFVYATREQLDPAVNRHPDVTYRYIKGASRTPMMVDKREMERFVRAVEKTEFPTYYTLNEIQPFLLGQLVRIIGGELDGYEGRIIEVDGKKGGINQLLIELPGFFAAGVALKQFDYIKPI